MERRPLRIPMFYKFLAGCVALAVLLIAGGAIVVRYQTRMESRGNYMLRHFKRYLAYQEGLGSAAASVADFIASEPLLRSALMGVASNTDAAQHEARAAQVAAHAFELLSRKGNIQPSFLLLVDHTGRIVWASPGPDGDDVDIGAADTSEMDVVFRVRTGSRYHDKVMIHEGRAYQVIGTPIRAVRAGEPNPGLGAAGVPAGPPAAPAATAASAATAGSAGDRGQIVGGLLMGVDLTRYMQQYKEQSDEREMMQTQMVLLANGKVVASVMPEEVWPELPQKLERQAWVYADDRGSFKQPYTRLSTGNYDLTSGPVEGFDGLESGVVGDLFLLRSRSDLAGLGPRIPWTEIAIGLILAVIIALLLARWITSPIQSFVNQSKKILEGETDLTQRIELHSRDETQDLAENINQVFARLYDLASDVQSAAFQVGASSAEISAASKEMLSGLKDQTLKIEGSTAAATELSASIQQVAANAAEATQVAEKSNESVTAAVARMQEIRESVEDAAAKMQELGESSKRIGNIVEVIRQISEQTSLLALNASIEAAHAGEHGRGFAVVADEVSSLARRVGQSAKDIETLIQTIKEQTADAVQSMQLGSREVEGGTALVTTTLTDLKTLIGVVKDTAAAVQEQAVVSDEIARNMDAVQTIASEMLAGSEESVAQSEQLHELAFQLERSVGGFNLDGKGMRLPLPEDEPRRLAGHSGHGPGSSPGSSAVSSAIRGPASPSGPRAGAHRRHG
jgi:methyl-accepting chemotaxis protein